MKYNSGNFDKYMTMNPLKRKMVSNLNQKILHLVQNSLVIQQDANNQSDAVKILDAGCGEGFISNLIYTNCTNIEITGLEYTEEALRIARKMNPQISFIQGDIVKMPFVSGAFDIVLCTEVLEHLADPSAALSELLRVARGPLIITVPHEPWFRIGNMLVLKNITRLGNPIDHINHWTFKGFKRFLNRHSKESWRMENSFPWTVAYCIKGHE